MKANKSAQNDVVDGVEIIEFDKITQMFEYSKTDFCAVQYGETAKTLCDSFRRVFGRTPDSILKFNNVFYIPVTKEEYEKWRRNISG